MRNKVFGLLLGIGMISSHLLAQTVANKPFVKDRPWLNNTLPVDKRVDLLISQMTLDEKISQMMDNSVAIDRLGIPKYGWWNEGLHGVANAGTATVFPQAIGLAATWDEHLIYDVSSIISEEARAKYNDAISKGSHKRFGGLTFWSPNINIFRDPRWGRGQETYGEDPFLTSRLGVNFVKGLQGNDPNYYKVVATPKHYAVHSGPESERHIFDAQTSDRDLWDTYLYAFRALITEGKAYSIMGAYNRFRGKSCSGDDFLLGEILRKKWGFQGFVVSDCDAVWDIYHSHKIVYSAEEASAIALKSGCDLDCGQAYNALKKAVTKGLVTEAEVDVSVKRLFKARFLLGMFDPTDAVPYNKYTIAMNDTKEHRAEALLASQKAIVLLKNENHFLPLKKNLNSIAVIGPNATNITALEGNYNGTSSKYVTVLDGIKNKVGAQTQVLYSIGCNINDNNPPITQVLKNVLFHNGIKGFKVEYFNNKDLKGAPVKTTIEQAIDFDWKDGSPYPGIHNDSFSLRATGEIIVKETAEYFVGVSGDDGYRLYIDGKLFVADWGNHGVTTHTDKIKLEAGRKYAIKLEYFESSGEASLSLLGEKTSGNLLAEAVETAKKSDVVVFVSGLSRKFEGEEMNVHSDGFSGGDRTDIKLPAVQTQLLKALYATGKPIIVVSITGSAVAYNWENEHLPAILQAWYPGEEGGNAVADVLFGDYNPAGRLPITFYKSIDDLPAFRDYNMKGRTYRYFEKQPLYPFGFGLSYSTFEYKNLKANKTTINKSETVSVRVDITNTSKIAGEEVAQLYVKQMNPSVARPIKELKGFKRISLAAGETKTINFEVKPEDLGYYDFVNNVFEVESGKFQLMVGTSSVQYQTLNLTVK